MFEYLDDCSDIYDYMWIVDGQDQRFFFLRSLPRPSVSASPDIAPDTADTASTELKTSDGNTDLWVVLTVPDTKSLLLH